MRSEERECVCEGGFNRKLKMRDRMIGIATAVYCIAAVAFFVMPPAVQNVWIWLPVSILTVTCALFGCDYRWLGAVALGASALGDVFGGVNLFLPQVGCFCVAQVVYTLIFIRNGKWNGWRALPAVVPLIVAAVVGSQVLPQTVGVERVGVAVYIAVIAAMSVSAMFVKRKGWWVLMIGALLFVASDSVIALNRFVERIPHAGSIIMSTYYAAQLLLGVSVMRWTDK